MLKACLLTALGAAALALPASSAATSKAAPRAPVSAFVPNDPGRGVVPGGWQEDQWNFTGPYGVDALGAWRHLIAARRPGGAGVVVAVVDSGVAYRNRPPYRRSPDLHGFRFVRGHDFVDDDRFPDDESGHGTHVASTIAEATDNGIGLTGLAYGVRIMPVRVLDRVDEGSWRDIARGIRWAAAHGAEVINVSIEFAEQVRPSDVRDVIEAIAFAHRAGAVVVASAGNTGSERVVLPARAPHAIAVGATTEHGCLSDFSNVGAGLDLVAPGGGADADLAGDTRCDPTDDTPRDIFQVTFTNRGSLRFGIPDRFEGTSMAAPHVSAVAALVLASGVLGPDPTPAAVEARLKSTARDLGPPGSDRRYGSGLLDAETATRKGPSVRRRAPPAPAPPAPGTAPPPAFD
ncbi:MAG: S8 family serine peptidase [Actinomycetota bacterium]|nr:S8 family serine peptidase [Actinomycetota bacterium]